MTYEVTIGIPVYNKEKYISLTLDSALAQTFNDIEFLVLDDCGSDSSMDIVREYQLRHPRGKDIRIVIQPNNMGVGEARNRIMDEAQGKYLFFLDADDTIEPDTIELLLNSAKEHNAQVVMASYEKEDYNDETITSNRYQLPFMIFQEENSFANYSFHKYGSLQANIWNVLIDLNLLRKSGIRFVKTNYWEDMVFKYELVTYVSRAVLLPNITYRYRNDEDTLSNPLNKDEIPKKKILRNVETIDVMKQRWKRMLVKPYFSNWFNFVLKTDLYIVCYVLNNKHKVTPFISNVELQSFLYSPLSLFETIRYGNTQCVFYKILSIFPTFIFIVLIKILQYILKLHNRLFKKKT